jgi:hypothetical protein
VRHQGPVANEQQMARRRVPHGGVDAWQQFSFLRVQAPHEQIPVFFRVCAAVASHVDEVPSVGKERGIVVSRFFRTQLRDRRRLAAGRRDDEQWFPLPASEDHVRRTPR